MECSNEIVRAGRGSWGGVDLDFAVAKTTTTWKSARGVGERAWTRYRFATSRGHVHEFGTLADAEADARLSIPEFVDVAGSDIDWLACDTPTLAPWVGHLVRSVVRSSDSGLTIDFATEVTASTRTPVVLTIEPLVEYTGRTIPPDDAAYDAQIQRFVGRRLIATDDYVDEGIVLDFGDAVLRIPAESIRAAEWPELILCGGPILLGDDPPWADRPALRGLWTYRPGRYDG